MGAPFFRAVHIVLADGNKKVKLFFIQLLGLTLLHEDGRHIYLGSCDSILSSL